jgi:hypothetical protein
MTDTVSVAHDTNTPVLPGNARGILLDAHRYLIAVHEERVLRASTLPRRIP